MPHLPSRIRRLRTSNMQHAFLTTPRNHPSEWLAGRLEFRIDASAEYRHPGAATSTLNTVYRLCKCVASIPDQARPNRPWTLLSQSHIHISTAVTAWASDLSVANRVQRRCDAALPDLNDRLVTASTECHDLRAFRPASTSICTIWICRSTRAARLNHLFWHESTRQDLSTAGMREQIHRSFPAT